MPFDTVRTGYCKSKRGLQAGSPRKVCVRQTHRHNDRYEGWIPDEPGYQFFGGRDPVLSESDNALDAAAVG